MNSIPSLAELVILSFESNQHELEQILQRTNFWSLPVALQSTVAYVIPHYVLSRYLQQQSGQQDFENLCQTLGHAARRRMWTVAKLCSDSFEVSELGSRNSRDLCLLEPPLDKWYGSTYSIQTDSVTQHEYAFQVAQPSQLDGSTETKELIGLRQQLRKVVTFEQSLRQMLQQCTVSSSQALERITVLKRRTTGGATAASAPGAAVSSRQHSDSTSSKTKQVKSTINTPSPQLGSRSIVSRGSRPSRMATTARIAKPAHPLASRIVGSERAGSMLKAGHGAPPQAHLRSMRQGRRSTSPRKTSTGTVPKQATALSRRTRSHASMRVTSAVPQPSTGHRLALARRIPSAGPAMLKAMGAGAPLLVVSRLAPLSESRQPVKSPHRQSPSRSFAGKQHQRAAGRAAGTGPVGASTGASVPKSGPHRPIKTSSGSGGTAGREPKHKKKAKASRKPSAEALAAARRIVRSMRAWLGRMRRANEQMSALRNAVQFPAHPAVLELMGAGTLVHPLILRPAAQCMRNLRRLSLRGCESLQTAEAVPTIVRSFPLLELLDLSGCRLLQDAELVAIGGGLIRLRVLEVATCRQITGDGLKAFAEAVHTAPVLQPASSGQESNETVKGAGTSSTVGDGVSSMGAGAAAREHRGPASSGAGTDIHTKGSEHSQSRDVGCVGYATPKIDFRGDARDSVPVSGPRMVRKVTEIPELVPALSKRLAPHGTSPKLTLGQRALQTSALRCLNLADCRGIDDAGVASLGRKLPGLRDLCIYGCLQLTGRCADGFGHLDCRLRRLNTAGVYKFGHEASSYLLQANPGLLLYNNPNEFDSSTRLAGGERWLL